MARYPTMAHCPTCSRARIAASVLRPEEKQDARSSRRAAVHSLAALIGTPAPLRSLFTSSPDMCQLPAQSLLIGRANAAGPQPNSVRLKYRQ